jgi:hypothetical protein
VAAGPQQAGAGRAGADGVGPGAGRDSTPKPFVERAQENGSAAGDREIVVTATAKGGDADAAEPSPDSAQFRGLRQMPAPLVEWTPSALPGGVSAPRPYRPRQALPVWTAPLVPGGGATPRP